MLEIEPEGSVGAAMVRGLVSGGILTLAVLCVCRAGRRHKDTGHGPAQVRQEQQHNSLEISFPASSGMQLSRAEHCGTRAKSAGSKA